MILAFKLDEPQYFNSGEKSEFLNLLIKQGQVANANLGKIDSCSFICIVNLDDVPIGIGAIKQVYKAPFDYAVMSELKEQFDYELGYLFVNDSDNLRGLGIGKTISKLLLDRVGDVNIFATTDMADGNSMLHILTKIGFVKTGSTYTGQRTKKEIGLFLRHKTEK